MSDAFSRQSAFTLTVEPRRSDYSFIAFSRVTTPVILVITMHSRRPASCLTCCCKRTPGRGQAPMRLGRAPWDLDLALMEPPHHTLVKGKAHPGISFCSLLKSSKYFLLLGLKKYTEVTNVLIFGFQAAATAANTLPAMTRPIHHAKPVRAKRQQQSTNMTLRVRWTTRCGA